MKPVNAVMAAQVESSHDDKEFFQWILKETLKETLEIVDVDEESRKASAVSYLKQGYVTSVMYWVVLIQVCSGLWTTAYLSPPWLKHRLVKWQKVAGYLFWKIIKVWGDFPNRHTRTDDFV